MKKLTVMLLAAVLMVTSIAVSYAADTFKDVKSTSWAYGSIKAMSDKQIITGYQDGTFRPDNILTYGEFIKMVVVSAGKGDPGAATKPEHWAKNYYDKGIELKYYTQYDIPVGALDQPIPRKAMALIISGAMGDVKVADFDKLQTGITDVSADTQYQYDIVKAYGSGVLSGYTDKTFKPEGTLNRAESASVIQRLTDESKRVLPSQATPGAVTTEGAYTFEGKYGGLSTDSKAYKIPFSSGMVVSVTKTGPITDMIANPERINGLDFGDGYKPKTKYVLTNETVPFDFSLKYGLINKTQIYGHAKGLDRVVLIKDGKIIKYVGGQTWDGYCDFDFNDLKTEPNLKLETVPDFDYLGSFDATSWGSEYVLIVPNPWK